MNAENSNLGNETITKLSETLDRYTASTLSSVVIPEFAGLPTEDVFAFLKRFKIATLTFSEELKCLALNKAFVGSAHTWSKANIKNLILSSDWGQIKKKIIKRFAPPDREPRYQEKLNKMRYESVRGTLISYIEEYVDTYKKAYGKVYDQDVIKSLSLNLPPNIIKHLNTLSDDWQQLSTLNPLYALIRRIEYKILPYEPKEIEEKIAKLLKELKQSFEVQKEKTENNIVEKLEKTEAVAALGRLNNYNQQSKEADNFGNNNYSPYQRDSNHRYRPNRQYGGSRGWQQRNHQYWQNDTRNQRVYMPDRNRGQYQRLLPHTGQTDIKSAYIAKYGKPPSPCLICDGEHFRRHCPYNDLN